MCIRDSPNPNHALLALGGLGAVVVLGLGIVVAVHPWSRSSPPEAASASAPIAVTNATNIPLASVESLASPTPVDEASSLSLIHI